jgi:hypothetical protein
MELSRRDAAFLIVSNDERRKLLGLADALIETERYTLFRLRGKLP